MALIKTLAGQFARIKVLGIGGGGGNAINSMLEEGGIKGVDLIAVNTDSQALLSSQADIKIQIGDKLTRGLGAGGNPKTGQQSAEESKEKIKEILQDTDMVFITGGMGGGTCTGAAPIIAKIAKTELGILTIGVVTKPFLFEGTRRMSNAEEGISQLKNYVDTLVVIPNQKVMEIVNNKATLLQAFKIADSVLHKGTKAIAQLVTTPGLINLDFADIKSVMSNAGTALMGVGEGSGEDRIKKALHSAIESPLIETDIGGARGILLNITGGKDITMSEIEEAAQAITDQAAPDANIIFGASIDEKLNDKIKITVIATGFTSIGKSSFKQKNFLPKLNKTPESSPKPDQNKSTPNQQLQDLLGDQNIPEGIDIVDQYDIPTFLRKKD